MFVAEVRKINQLTSLRFFAALFVMFSHLSFLTTTNNTLKPAANTLFHEGFSGVSFFFTLSGFILCHTYGERLKQGVLERRKYFLLRLARIYPLHFLTAVPFAIISIYKMGVGTLHVIIPNILLLQSWIPNSKYYYSLNDVSWSLSDELFFYICFMFLVLLSTKLLRNITILSAVVIVVGLCVCIGYGNGYWGDGTNLKPVHYWSYISPLTRLVDFNIGILIYRQRSLATQERSAGTMTKHEIVSVVLWGAAMTLAPYFNLPEILRSQVLYMPITAYVIWSFSIGSGHLSKALNSSILILMGESSFALYMIHLKIIDFCFGFYGRHGMTFPLELLALILVLLSLVASVVVYKCVELPIHNYLRVKINNISRAA